MNRMRKDSASESFVSPAAHGEPVTPVTVSPSDTDTADPRRRSCARTVAKLLELAPNFTIEASVQEHLPYVPKAMNHYVQGLHKAGVPER